MFVLVINPFSSVVGFFQILREISGPLAAGYKLAANCVCLLLDAGKKTAEDYKCGIVLLLKTARSKTEPKPNKLVEYKTKTTS